MHIGFTYDLRDDYLAQGLSEEAVAEFDRPDTIEAVAQALASFGHRVTPIGNLHALLPRLMEGERWDLVFNIAEGLHGAAREAQVPALLDAFDIPYVFSDPLVSALTLHKAMAKRVVRDAGLATADFYQINERADLSHIALPYPLFVKPVAEGTSKGIDARSRVSTHNELTSLCCELLHRFKQPVLVETWLPGREFTVGIVGTQAHARVLGVLEVTLNTHAEAEIYSWHNKENYSHCVDYRLCDDDDARAGAELALKAWQVLGCRDAGRVDVRLDVEGKPQFIEANPLPGLNPQRSDLAILNAQLGRSYQELIGEILESALRRIPVDSSKLDRLSA